MANLTVVAVKLYSSLYILEIKSLLITHIANIFSHCVGCFLFLFIVSLVVQKLIVWLGPIYLFFILFLLS